MSQIERFYTIDRMLQQGPVKPRALRDAFEVSPATLKRDIEYMRSRLYAPIVFERSQGVYRFDFQQPNAKRYALPGLWFSETEIHALLTLQHLVSHLEPGGILQKHIQPLEQRLEAQLEKADPSHTELRRRVLIVGLGVRRLKLKHFQRVGSALLQRRRIDVTYATRGRGELTTRILSPQRLVHYRENWYLDAWCHLRKELRNFALDAMQEVVILDEACKEIPAKQLESTFGTAYGIFAGKKIQWAHLRFTPERARWVAQEQWHSQQKSRYDKHGNYLLDIPYADHRELLMDILKYGAQCEVLAPQALRQLVMEEIAQMKKIYGG